ncbi:MAG TPA: glycosyltransferase family 4 protein [Stellaceae bacterium]|nr:glycosyltransferase family 4 protein [Stellaceae bacterium]
MNILWLPHAPLRTGRTRSDHLIERLAGRHRVTVVSFRTHARAHAWRYLGDLFSHRSRYGATYAELAVCRFPRATSLNGWLLNRAIRRELGRVRQDVLVVAPAPYLTGYLDFAALRGKIPVVCDYLDGGDWTQTPEVTEFERRYIAAADAVMCVSKGLLRQASSLNPRSFYVPNGVELDRYRTFRASHSVRECKTRLGIDPDAFVVSIIGMTCSPRLYFVDAIVELASKGRNVVLLLVGDSPLLEEIRSRAGGASRAVRIAGPIPYAEIMPYFMATDLGLSAVDEHPYYHFQSPLKIFEYGAMGKPVLASPRVEEVAETALSHVQFCEADAESLARHIERAMTAAAPAPEPDLERYDWDRIARTVEEILMDTAQRYASEAPGPAGMPAGRMP